MILTIKKGIDVRREVYIVFRGTHNTKDLLFDAVVAPTELPGSPIQYHQGFYYHLDTDRRLCEALETIAKKNKKEIYRWNLTGHSLGGAKAIVTMSMLL